MIQRALTTASELALSISSKKKKKEYLKIGEHMLPYFLFNNIVLFEFAALSLRV
jgi:hypothetical protein